MNEDPPLPDDPLRVLLARVPDEVQVNSGPNRLVLRFRQRGVTAPQRVRDADPTVAVAIVLGVVFWTGLAFSLVTIMQMPEEFALGAAFAVTAGPLLLLLVVGLAIRQTHTEVDLSGGEIRINRWRKQLRDLKAARYEHIRARVKGGTVEDHFVRIDGPDHAWRCIPGDGESVARWVADVIDVRIQQARQDTAQPPGALLDVIDAT